MVMTVRVYVVLLVVICATTCVLCESVSSDGCADGGRDALVDVEVYRRVAACSAAWSLPGVVYAKATGATTQGSSCTPGNGYGCSVHDACARGWHVCASPTEVDNLSVAGTCAGVKDHLYLTTASTALTQKCDVHSVEHVLGCGVGGATETGAGSTCQPTAAGITADTVAAPWAVRGSMYDLSRSLVKRTVGAGGVMCCLDHKPTVFTIKPKLGPNKGGTRVTITGIDLGVDPADVKSVTIGGSPCIDVKWASSTSLQCTTTLHNATESNTLATGTGQAGATGTETAPEVDSGGLGQEVVVTTHKGGIGVGLTSGEYTYTSPGADLVAALVGGVTITGIKPAVVDPKTTNHIYIRGTGWNGTDINDISASIAGFDCLELRFTKEGYLVCLAPPLLEAQAKNISTVAVVTVDGKGSATSAERLRFLQEGEKVCTAECSFTSECDLTVGECACRTGWTGEQCTSPSILHTALSTKQVSESGTSATFQVRLAVIPDAEVKISYTSSDDTEALVAPDLVTFDSRNWDKPQTITITGLDDYICDGSKPFAVVRTVASADRRFDGAPATTNDPLVLTNKGANGKIVEIYPPTVGMTGDKVWIVVESVCFAPVFRVDGVVYHPESRSRVTKRKNAKARTALAQQQAVAQTHRRARVVRILQTASNQTSEIEIADPIELPVGQEEFIITLRNQTVPEGYRTLSLSAEGAASINDETTLVTQSNAEDKIFFTAKCKDDGMFGTGAGCRDCPLGAVCPGGTRAWPTDGYWTPSETSGIVRACPRPQSCRATGTGQQECATGYEGDMCGKCSNGYYEQNQACVQCPPASDATYYVLADVILWTSLAVCGILITHQMLFSYIVMLVKSLQALAAIGAMGTERLPDWLQSVYSFLHLFSGDYSFMKPDCYNPTSVEEKFYSGLVYNLVIFLPLLFGVPLAGCINYMYNKYVSDRVDSVIQASKNWYKDRTVRCFIIFLSTAYLPATSRSVAMLACQDMGEGVMYMIIEPSHRCYATDEYWTALVVACIILASLTVSFPLFMMNYLRVHKARMLVDDRFGERFNFLYEFYKPGFTLFWAIEFAISCVIANASSTFVPHPKYQLSICTIVFGIKLIFILWKGPFLDWITNSIQVLLTIALLVAVNANYLLSLDLTRRVVILRQSLPVAIVLLAGATVVSLIIMIIYMALKGEEEEDEEDDDDWFKKGGQGEDDDMFDIGFAVATSEDESVHEEMTLEEAETSLFATLANLLPESEHGNLQRRMSTFFASVIGGDEASVDSEEQVHRELGAAAEEVILEVDNPVISSDAEEMISMVVDTADDDFSPTSAIIGIDNDDDGDGDGGDGAVPMAEPSRPSLEDADFTPHASPSPESVPALFHIPGDHDTVDQVDGALDDWDQNF